MTDKEQQLLSETKSSINKSSEQPKTELPTKKSDPEVDVDALLKMHGLSHETQGSSNTKWVALIVLTVSLIVLMIVVTIMLNSVKDA